MYSVSDWPVFPLFVVGRSKGSTTRFRATEEQESINWKELCLCLFVCLHKNRLMMHKREILDSVTTKTAHCW